MGDTCAIGHTSGQTARVPTPPAYTRACVPRVLIAAVVLLALAAPATATAAQSPPRRSAGAWQKLQGRPAATHNGNRPQVAPRRFRALSFDRGELAAVLAAAPRERTRAARVDPLTISLPAPDGAFRRFAIQRSPVMAPGSPPSTPEIATYSGAGIDDPGRDRAPRPDAARLPRVGPRARRRLVRRPVLPRRPEPLRQLPRRGPRRPRTAASSERERRAPPGADAAARRGRRVDGAARHAAHLPARAGQRPDYAAYHGAANVTAAKVDADQPRQPDLRGRPRAST